MANLRATLAYEPVELSFGTSGLRGLVSDMTDLECYINAVGFIRFLQQHDALQADETIFIAGDLRESTPRILGVMCQAARDQGLTVVYSGLIPTPAVASYALSQQAPCIMVTGSHIPADRNGIKFYKRRGEVLKPDEHAIKQAVAAVRAEQYGLEASASLFSATGMLQHPAAVPAVQAAAAEAYIQRYVDIFGQQALAGRQLVFYQHSAVGRDLLVELLQRLGAVTVPVGRSDSFVPIDTENVTPADQAYFKQLAADHPDCFAIVSTDGDSDRPFLVDEQGVFNRGDVLGAVVAKWLQADAVAIPVSSSDAVEQYLGTNIPVVRTKIGSPYVIAAMEEAQAQGSERVVGWEVNGGFLTGSALSIQDKTLPVLPTRDAIFPIITALCAARDAGQRVSELFATLPPRYTQAGLLDDFPIETSAAILARYAEDTPANRQELARYFTAAQGFGDITGIDALDGIRLSFSNGDIAHLRPSGNAPQLRLYSVADNQQRADDIVALAISEQAGLLRQLEQAVKAT